MQFFYKLKTRNIRIFQYLPTIAFNTDLVLYIESLIDDLHL